MSPNYKASTPEMPDAVAQAVAAHGEVMRLRGEVAAAKEVRRKAIEVALDTGATLRLLGDELGVSAQAVQAMTKVART